MDILNREGAREFYLDGQHIIGIRYIRDTDALKPSKCRMTTQAKLGARRFRPSPEHL